MPNSCPDRSQPPPDLILAAELVPQTSWYDNLRKVISRDAWDVLRRDVYAHYGHRCAICEAKTRLHCHEFWEYDDASHIQTLCGFIALCEMCHHIKHLGLAGILASEGRLNYSALIAHFCRVNGCDRATFNAHRDAAFTLWEQRSQYPWTVDLGQWEDLFSTPAQRRS